MKLETKNIFAASDWFDLNFFEEFIPSDISIKKKLIYRISRLMIKGFLQGFCIIGIKQA